MNLDEKTLAVNYIYKGRIINVRNDDITLPNGKLAAREVVEHPGGVCVAALDNQNNLLLVRQYRYPYLAATLELPAGKLSKGEYPLECAKRELKEETGAICSDYTFLGKLYPSPGYCNEIIYMYFAKVIKIENARPEPDEFIEALSMPFDKAVEAVLSNEICDAKTQTAILKTYALLSSGKLV